MSPKIEATRRYGCGSGGPRNFSGQNRVSEYLENSVAVPTREGQLVELIRWL